MAIGTGVACMISQECILKYYVLDQLSQEIKWLEWEEEWRKRNEQWARSDEKWAELRAKRATDAFQEAIKLAEMKALFGLLNDRIEMPARRPE